MEIIWNAISYSTATIVLACNIWFAVIDGRAAVIDSCARPLSCQAFAYALNDERRHPLLWLTAALDQSRSDTRINYPRFREFCSLRFLRFKMFSLVSFRCVFASSIEEQMTTLMKEFTYGESAFVQVFKLISLESDAYEFRRPLSNLQLCSAVISFDCMLLLA